MGGDILLAILLAGIFVVFGLAFFPNLNLMFSGIDTTGMFPVLAAGIKLMPYIVLVIVIWVAIQMIKNKVNH